MRYLMIMIIALICLTGCADDQSRQSAVPEVDAQAQSDARGPVKGLDRDSYYASRYDARAGIYCGLDPELHDIPSDGLGRYDTLAEAQEAFPQNKLFRNCDQFAIEK